MDGGNGTKPSRLAGARVLWNGEPVPLLFASPGQINAQMPFSVRPGEMGRLSVSVAGRQSIEVLLDGKTATPAVVAVTARRGVMSIYCFGLGAVDPPVRAGELAPSDPVSRTVRIPVVLLNGESARVLYSGLAPGWAGLYQVDVEDRSAPGPSLSIVIQMPE